MSGIIYTTGTISARSVPIDRESVAYRLGSTGDLDITIFVMETSPELDPHFRRASEFRAETLRDVYVPSVIDRQIVSGVSQYIGWLLIPPNISKESDFFALGMAVPDLRVIASVGQKGLPIGYVLQSTYLGSQDFFTPFRTKLSDDRNVRYIGVIQELTTGGTRRPVVELKVSSEDNESLYQENKPKLEGIVNPTSNFWWNKE